MRIRLAVPDDEFPWLRQKMAEARQQIDRGNDQLRENTRRVLACERETLKRRFGYEIQPVDVPIKVGE